MKQKSTAGCPWFRIGQKPAQSANAERILPESQDPKVGDALDRAGNMRVKAVVPGRMLVLGPPPTPDLQVTWAMCLYAAGNKATRLVSRCRARLPRTAKGILTFLVLDPGQFLMERKMLLEVKRRAESHPVVPEKAPTLVKDADEPTSSELARPDVESLLPSPGEPSASSSVQ